jgi:hypothetical protein
MQDARSGWLAVTAVVAALAAGATGCADGSGDAGARKVRTDARPASSHRAAPTTTSTTTAAPAVAPLVVPSAGPTATTAPAPAPAPAAPPPVVTVSVTTVQSGSVTRSDGAACSDVSSQTLAKGEVEVRRSGSTAAALTVRYSTTGTTGDFTPLPGSVTIPAGAASATVDVIPTMDVGPAPQHVHRSSAVTFAVLDDPAYDVAAPATAAVSLTFDVDVFGCDPPTS